MTYEEYLQNKYVYQEEGYRLLIERKHACLFYKPGKGKTYPTIDALRDVSKYIEDKYKREPRILILSTADAIRNMWETEIVPQKILPKNTILMTFSQAIQPKTKPQLLKVNWDVVIADECHKLKSNSTQISKLVYQLTRRTEYAWGLTGTPRGNNDVDIFCQFHNLNVAEWGDVSYTRFTTTCCDMQKQYFGGRVFQKPVGISDKYRAGWERNVAMYSQRADYDEEDKMPPLNTEVIRLPYEKSKEYTQALSGVIDLPDYSTTMAKFAAVLKAHQAANGYLYLENKLVHKFQVNKKLNWLLNFSKTVDKALIVYRFTEDLNAISAMCDENKIQYTENIDEFKKGTAKFLLLQCARCESFNLQMCQNIVFYTLDYSFIKYDQMLHRCWRKGQEKDTKLYILLFENSVEEDIWKTVETKQTLSELFYKIKGV